MERTVFISYAHEDRKWCELLLEHLAPLENEQLISVWDDSAIRATSQEGWEAQLLPKLNEAHVILVLLSSSFAKSKYCQDVELPRAIKRKREGEAIVVFVLARKYAVEQQILQFQVLPSSDRSIEESVHPDREFTVVAEQIRSRLKSFKPLKNSQGATGLIPEVLPYLCNRHPQTDRVGQLLDNENRDRPIVAISTGSEKELHDGFHERLALEFLPRKLGCPVTEPRRVEWPQDAGAATIQNRVADALGSGRNNLRDMAGDLSPGVTFLDTVVSTDSWNPGKLETLRGLLRFWESWPSRPDRSVCFTVAIKGKRRGLDIAKLVLPETYPKVRLAVLPPLMPPTHEDAENWLRLEQVRPFAPYSEEDRSKLVQAMFRRWVIIRRRRMSMKELSPKLRGALRNN